MTISLTRRETQVLAELATGMSIKEIAVKWGRSPDTLDVHRTNLMRKFEIHDIVRLTHVAIRHGIVKLLEDDFEFISPR